MERSRLLGVSWVSYTVFLIAAGLLTAINLVRPLDFFVGDFYEAYVGEPWSAFAAAQPKQAALYEVFNQGAAGATLSAILLGLFITLGAYRRGQRWAWIALLVGLVAASATDTLHCLMARDVVGVLFWASWLCVGLVILLLPAKEMLHLKATSAAPTPAGTLGRA